MTMNRMLSEVYKELERSDGIYDFEDAVTVVRLRLALNSYELDLLGFKSEIKFSKEQQREYKELLLDIAALKHVIKFFEVAKDW